MKTKTLFTAGALILFVASNAFAQPGMGPGMGGMGMGPRHGMGGGMGHCMKALQFAPPEFLKSKLGLSDQQISQIQTIRTNVLTKSIKLGSEAQLQKLQLAVLFQTDVPDEGKVLAIHRKVRSIRGQIAEERIKSGISVLKVLSKEQRSKIRTECFSRMGMGPMGGPGMGGMGGMGGRGGRGGHSGWGGGHGGHDGPGGGSGGWDDD